MLRPDPFHFQSSRLRRPTNRLGSSPRSWWQFCLNVQPASAPNTLNTVYWLICSCSVFRHSSPLGRAGPRNAQSRGSRQPVRFGGTPEVHRHRLAEPYRCATGGLRRARPVRELWPLRRHPVRETSTGLKNRSWTGCARRDRGHGCVGSLHSRGREPWRRTGFGYCPQPGAPRYPCTSGHTNPRSLALVAPRRTGPALCPSLIATRSVQQAHPPTVPSAG